MPLEINVEIKCPAAMVKSGSDLLFVSDLFSSRILELGIEQKHSDTLDSFVMVGTCLSVIDIDNLTLCYGLACKADCLYVADHNRGILKVDLGSRETSVIVSAGSNNCCRPHDITLINNDIVFTDIDAKRICSIENGRVANENVSIVVLAGSGEAGKVDGLGAESSFLQPTGICSEGNTVLTVDSGNKAVRLLTSLKAICRYLEVIKDLYLAFLFIQKFLEKEQVVIYRRAFISYPN